MKKSTQTILILHNDAQRIHWLRTCLQSQTDSVVTATSMAQGMELLPLVLPHLILLDATSVAEKPEDYFQALREKSGQAPVLLVVPQCSADMQAEYLTWPADDYLLEPYAISVLNTKVADLLAGIF